MPTIFLKNNTTLPERREFDLYPTENMLIIATLKAIQPLLAKKPDFVLDPGAGDGRWGSWVSRTSKTIFGMDTNPMITGVDIRDVELPLAGFTSWYPNQDFLTWKTDTSFDLIIGNPPYKFSEKFVRHAWEMLSKNGTMVFLLKIGFMASVSRYEGLWNELYPECVFVCSTRPSFYNGSTGGDEYAVYVWNKNGRGKPVGKPRTWTTKLLHYKRAG
jgi:hypothetical protein